MFVLGLASQAAPLLQCVGKNSEQTSFFTETFRFGKLPGMFLSSFADMRLVVIQQRTKHKLSSRTETAFSQGLDLYDQMFNPEVPDLTQNTLMTMWRKMFLASYVNLIEIRKIREKNTKTIRGTFSQALERKPRKSALSITSYNDSV